MKNRLATVVAHGAVCLDQVTLDDFTVIINEEDHIVKEAYLEDFIQRFFWQQLKAAASRSPHGI